MSPKSIVEKIYYGSPVLLQNIMTSIYGLELHRQRYGRKSESYRKYLGKSQSYSKNELRTLQEELLKKMIDHAFATVPFYKELAKQTGVGPKDIAGLDDLNKMPILEKKWIRENPERFCSGKYLNANDSFWLNTSGTTGSPLRILCDRESRRLHYAFWTRLRESMGLNKRSRRATFFGRVICSPQQGNPPFWRYDLVGRNKLFSSYHMSDNNLPSYYSELKKYLPDEIIGYPSSLFLLSKYINKNRLEKLSPKVVITTAETLTAWQKDEIRRAFPDKCMLIDQYGSTEMVHFVAQCPYGAYHVNPEHGIVEIINASADNTGEVVCTGFVNYSMPLIRYRLGDVLRMSEESCVCGSNFPVVQEIIGRVDDLLITPDGRPLGRMDPIFKGMKGIRETQIIQTKADTLLVLIAVECGFDEAAKSELMKEIRKRTGGDMEISIKMVESIPKDRNGKFKSVVSQVKYLL